MDIRKSLISTLKIVIVLAVWVASFIAYDLYLESRIARRIIRIVRRTPPQ